MKVVICSSRSVVIAIEIVSISISVGSSVVRACVSISVVIWLSIIRLDSLALLGLLIMGGRFETFQV